MPGPFTRSAVQPSQPRAGTWFPLCKGARGGQGQGPAKCSWGWRPGLPAWRRFLPDATAVPPEHAWGRRSELAAESGLQQQAGGVGGTPTGTPHPRPDGGDWQVLQEPREGTREVAQSQRCVQISEPPASRVTLGSMSPCLHFLVYKRDLITTTSSSGRMKKKSRMELLSGRYDTTRVTGLGTQPVPAGVC